jgi:hypothetical protein
MRRPGVVRFFKRGEEDLLNSWTLVQYKGRRPMRSSGITAGLVSIAVSKVESIFVSPTDFSPLK